VNLSQVQESAPFNDYASFVAGQEDTYFGVGSHVQGFKRCDRLLVINPDVVPHDVSLQLHVGSAIWDLGSATVAAGAGQGMSSPVDLLARLLGSPSPGIALDATSFLQVAVAGAITAGKTITVAFLGGFL
jgi:hypothetical protein